MRIYFGEISCLTLAFTLQIVNVVHGQERRIDFRYDRIVTDLKSFRLGADIDYSYNETAEFPGQVISSPGCPKAHEGRQWVYYGNPIKCYLEGFRGPCSLGQRIFASVNSKYGVCNCNCFTEHVHSALSTSSTQFSYNVDNNDISQNQFFLPNRRRVRSHYNYHGNRVNRINSASNLTPKLEERERRQCTTLSKTSTTSTSTSTPSSIDDYDSTLEVSSYLLTSPKRDKNRYKFCYSDWYKRQVLYDSVRQECIPFLTQGPCRKGEWLVRNLARENGVECEKRKCPEIISSGNKTQQMYGGSYSYFDYRTQACYTEVYGNLQESFFATSGNIIPVTNSRFCRDSGMRYSQVLKTCVKDVSRVYQYKVVG